MKTTFLFTFWLLISFFSNYKFTSKQKEAFLCFHVCVYPDCFHVCVYPDCFHVYVYPECFKAFLTRTDINIWMIWRMILKEKLNWNKKLKSKYSSLYWYIRRRRPYIIVVLLSLIVFNSDKYHILSCSEMQSLL